MFQGTVGSIVIFAVCSYSVFGGQPESPGFSADRPRITWAPTPLEAVYTGDESLSRDLRTGVARPLSVAATDLDNDGIEDLIAGHGGPADLITVHLGNPDAFFPRSPSLVRRETAPFFDDGPFMRTARVFKAPGRPDFLAAGDFNNDGFSDVVVASRDEDAVYLLAGDGTGRLRTAGAHRLNGRVSAMMAGEANRPDGLPDLVVCVSEPRTHAALVFEDPRGALTGEPERVELPAPATTLALGQLDDDFFADLVVGAGHDLLIVHGRDRELSVSESTRRKTRLPIVERLEFDWPIASVTVADCLSEIPGRPRAAALTEDGAIQTIVRGHSTRQSVDSIGSQSDRMSRLEVREWIPASGAEQTAAASTLLLAGRSSGNPAACLSTVEAEATLAMRLGPNALTDFVMVRQGELVIAKTTLAATITVNSIADTTVAADALCTLREAIINANTNADTTAGDCAPGAGLDEIVFLVDGGGTTVTIHVSSALPPITDAVVIDGTSQGCVSPPCIELDGALAGSPDVDGLLLEAGGSTVRGLAVNQFSRSGIRVDSSGNFIEGNFIGTDPDGTLDLGNGVGVSLIGASNNTIGGAAPGAGNLISGNVTGIDLSEGSTGNRIIGNLVGTDAAGESGLGNTRGVAALAAGGNTIGGAMAGEGNVISGNGPQGIWVRESDGTVIQGNLVGTNATGGLAVPNSSLGVVIQDSADATVGGTAVGAGNVISGNGSAGMLIAEINGIPTTGNRVQGNFIGTDRGGATAVPNGAYGIIIRAKDNLVGGTGGARNVISANGNHGIYVVTAAQQLPPSEGNQVLGNHIGTDVTGTLALGNTGAGVSINGAARNTIGGPLVEEGNLIANNQQEGVLVQGTAPDNAVTGNRIYSNGRLAIDLGPSDGVTPNDPADPDAGPNALQNFPVLSLADASPTASLVEGSLDSTADSTFRVEFFANSTCDESLHGEGERFLGSTSVTTTGGVVGSFSAILPAWVSDGDAVAATATSEAGSTSEFGACLVATCSSLVPFAQTVTAPDKAGFVWSTPADVRWVVGDLAAVSSYVTSGTGVRYRATGLNTTADAPAPGSGQYYLFKPLGCGSWQTALGGEPGRDPGLP